MLWQYQAPVKRAAAAIGIDGRGRWMWISITRLLNEEPKIVWVLEYL